jgi:hypothetical protein
VNHAVIRKRILRIFEWVVLGLSGALAYYACEALCDYFAFREGVNADVGRFFFFLFPLLAVTAFVLLTFAWHRILPQKGRPRFPEILMVLGVLILMPVYFELASHLIYNPTAIHLSEIIDDLYWFYLLFPLTVMDIVTYTFSLHVFAMAALSALLTGYLLRRRVGRLSEQTN